MVFLTIIFIIVVGYCIHCVNNSERRITYLEEELNRFKQINTDLYRKVNYLYGLIQKQNAPPPPDLNTENTAEKAPQKTTKDVIAAAAKTAESVVVKTAESAYAAAAKVAGSLISDNDGDLSVGNNENVAASVTSEKTADINENVAASATSEKTADINENVAASATAENVAVPSKTAVDSEVKTAQVYNTNISESGYTSAQSNSPYKEKSAPRKPITIKSAGEGWFASQFFSIVASIMIFIGLILFCTLSTDVVSNGAKAAAMFVVSCGFIGAGAFLSKKDKSAFPKALIGCGFGTFFITTLVSHIYFDILNEIAAFGLILVWSCIALYMSKRLDSLSLSIIAHAGTAISIAFGYTTLYTSPEKLVILSLYQIAALTVIIVGNIFFCRKTYRFGLIMSQVLLLYTTIVIADSIPKEKEIFSYSIIIILNLVQILAAFFVSYLVSVSSNTLEKESIEIMESSKIADINSVLAIKQNAGKLFTVSGIIHIANIILWGITTTVSAASVTDHLAKDLNSGHSALIIMTVLLVCYMLHLFITLLINQKLDFSNRLSEISILIISVFTVITMIYGSYDDLIIKGSVPCIFIYVLLLAVIMKKTKLSGITKIATFTLIFEAIYMTFIAYSDIRNGLISTCYLFAVCATGVVLWYILDEKTKQKYFDRLKLAEYIFISASILSINLNIDLLYMSSLIIIEYTVLNLICFFVKYEGKKPSVLYYTVRIESLLTIFIGIVSLSTLVNSDGKIIPADIIMLLFVSAISIVYSWSFAQSKRTIANLLSAFIFSSYITMLSDGLESKFFLFKIYTYLLDNQTFFLVFAACAVAIYWFKKRDSMRPFIWISMIINSLYMLSIGYSELIDVAQVFNNRWYEMSVTEAAPLRVIGSLAAVAHAAIILTFILILKERGEGTKFFEVLPRYALYLWVNVSFSAIIYQLLDAIELVGFPIISALIVLCVINIGVYLFKYNGKYRSIYYYMVSIISSIIYLTALVQIAERQLPISNIGFMFTKTVLVLLTIALYFIKAKQMLKNNRNVYVQIIIGIGITALMNAICSCYYNNFDFFAIFSIITMLTSLACIIVGFKIKSKGLRLYGLVVVMLCIIKLVTIDIIDENSLTRVVAFISGGIICFIISAIYNKLETSVTKNT